MLRHICRKKAKFSLPRIVLHFFCIWPSIVVEDFQGSSWAFKCFGISYSMQSQTHTMEMMMIRNRMDLMIKSPSCICYYGDIVGGDTQNDFVINDTGQPSRLYADKIMIMGWFSVISLPDRTPIRW